MFIRQVFYGCLRYKEFLKVFTDVFYNSRRGTTSIKDIYLYTVFAYITIFRLNELPIDDFNLLILVRSNNLFNLFSLKIM